MKNVQNATCDGDFAPLRSQNCCEIKFRPIYIIRLNVMQGKPLWGDQIPPPHLANNDDNVHAVRGAWKVKVIFFLYEKLIASHCVSF